MILLLIHITFVIIFFACDLFCNMYHTLCSFKKRNRKKELHCLNNYKISRHWLNNYKINHGVMCMCEHVCGVGGEKEVFCLRPGMYVFSAPAACTIRCCWMGHFPQNPCWQKWVHFWILRWSKYYVIHFVSNLFVVVVCFLADDLILEISCIFFQ